MALANTKAKARARPNKTFKVQASLMIVTYDCQNIFIVQATVKPSGSCLCSLF